MIEKETKYAYFVSYFWAVEPGEFALGMAEVITSRPITDFEQVVNVSKVCAAKTGACQVSVLTWKLLREES